MIGIYEITIKASKANSKSYIGKSTEIENRLHSHKRVLKKGNHICKEMQKDYNSFLNDCKFDIVEECKKEELDKREQYWIKQYKAVEWGYNYSKLDKEAIKQQAEKANGKFYGKQ